MMAYSVLQHLTVLQPSTTVRSADAHDFALADARRVMSNMDENLRAPTESREWR
jgi:hypothetical protein